MNTRSFVTASALLLAQLGCRDGVDSPSAPSSGKTQWDIAVAITETYRQISAGTFHTYAVTTDDRAYCWGWNYRGQLGIGYRMPFQEGRARPVAVLGGLRFRNVSAGYSHTCGVTTDYRAYCWGDNYLGHLGTGTLGGRLEPAAVTGGLHFRTISAGQHHTCATSYPDNRAYCWGSNEHGQLGDGTTAEALAPRAVAGGRVFRAVSAGIEHSCGVTTDNQAYCWGGNGYGQLGVGTEVPQVLRPSVVTGGHQFRQLDAGEWHTCAVTTTLRGYCWGEGWWGELGTGKSHLSFWPRAVAGGLSLDRVSAGFFHTCGETTNNRAWCWGGNDWGQLGIGSSTGPVNCPTDLSGSLYCSLNPVAVRGQLSFVQVSAGGYHTCGIAATGATYCWGGNWYGEVGDGSKIHRLVPTRVLAGVSSPKEP